MTEEEERIISEYYSEEVKFSELAEKMVNRSTKWVEKEYIILFREKIGELKKHHLNQNLTQDEICQQVKDRKLTIDYFKHVDKQDQKNIREILEFVGRDQHGQKMIKRNVEASSRSRQRDPEKNRKTSRNYRTKKRVLQK